MAKLVKIIIVSYITFTVLVPLHAQDVTALTKTDTEIGGFAGASYGIDRFRFMGGANIARAWKHRFFMPYGEFSYFPGIGRRETLRDGSLREFEIPLYDVNAGVHIRVPVHERFFVPYGVLGVGVIHTPQTTRTVVDLGPPRQEVELRLAGTTDFAVNAGGGIRVYVIAGKLGFRVEAKVYKPTGQYTDTFGKVVGGIFFQFKRKR
jgi:hypothetical protein